MQMQIDSVQREIVAVFHKASGCLYLPVKGTQGTIMIDSMGFVSNCTGSIFTLAEMEGHDAIYTGDKITLIF